MNTDQLHYYAKRAKEYEKIYDKPERQEDIKSIVDFLKNTYSNKMVFEIACGTGFWTTHIAEAAKSILATDVNQAVLEIAKTKKYLNPVKFELADVYDLKNIQETFDSCFGGFIWSHIPKQKLKHFLSNGLSKIEGNGIISFIDNQYVDGSSTPISEIDAYGNAFQIRSLTDGSKHKVLKNFPSDSEISEIIEPFGSDIKINRLDYFWILSFKKRKFK